MQVGNFQDQLVNLVKMKSKSSQMSGTFTFIRETHSVSSFSLSVAGEHFCLEGAILQNLALILS